MEKQRIVYMVRHSLNYGSWKRRNDLASDLRLIYTAATVEEAEPMLGEFEDRWDEEYLPIGRSLRWNWSRLIPFFDCPPEIRKVSCTTNSIELADEIPDSHIAGGVLGRPLRLDIGIQAIAPGHGLRSGAEDLRL